ncbi:YycH family regulatory protein [Enterococcus sp. LJL120]
MKLSDKLIRLALVLLIALSIFLSYNIWLSPANTSSETRNTAVNTENQNSRNADDVFLPLKMIQLVDGVASGSQSETAIGQIHDLLSTNIFGELTLETSDDENFVSSQMIQNGLEFSYQGSYLLSDYLATFKIEADNSEESEGFYFSKVQLDFDNQVAKFVSYGENAYMQMAFSGTASSYQQILDGNSLNWTAVSLDETSTTGQYNSSETIELSNYSYILSTQSSTLFRNAFFQDPSDVTNESATTFISGQERLEIDSDQQLAEFHGELPVTDGLTDEFNQSFAYISKLGSNVGNLRYFDREDEQLNYRVFVEGYPVFGQNWQGLVAVEVEDNPLEDNLSVSINTSTRTIQVPIPTDETEILPSTETVRNEIQAAGGDLTLATSVIIGYTWEAIRDVDRVVDLKPEWYIRYDKKWYSMRELLDTLADAEVN